MLDLGCGHGAWLLEVLTQDDAATGVGVDISLPADVPSSTETRALTGRVRWEQADARTWHGGTFDVVLCVGASHAFGGLDGTLDAVRRHLRPGGQVVLGDAIWRRRRPRRRRSYWRPARTISLTSPGSSSASTSTASNPDTAT